MAGQNNVPKNNQKKEIVTPKQEIKTQEINIEELIKKVTLEVTGQYENKIKELEEKLVSKEEVKTEVNKVENNLNKKYKFIPDNTKIRVRSNVDGKFIYTEDRGKTRVFIQIDDYNQTSDISYDELRVIKPILFKTGQLAIENVFSDGDIELEDLLKDIRFDGFYLDKNKVNPNDIEYLLSDKTSVSEFENKFSKTPDMMSTVLEVAYILYRNGQFNDNNKMNYLRQIFGNPNLFK